MDSDTLQLVMDVANGNPGALTIVRRLMYYAMWRPLLVHLKAQGLVGGELWQIVKDEYDHDWTRFVDDRLALLGQGRTQTPRVIGLRKPYNSH